MTRARFILAFTAAIAVFLAVTGVTGRAAIAAPCPSTVTLESCPAPFRHVLPPAAPEQCLKAVGSEEVLAALPDPSIERVQLHWLQAAMEAIADEVPHPPPKMATA